MAEFIRNSDSPVSKREIGRALHVGAGHRRALNAILNELEDDNVIDRDQRRYSSSGGIPPVGVLEVDGLDQDGEPLLRPVSWKSAGAPPRIYLAPERKGPAPGLGDRILARLKPLDGGAYEARIMRRLPSQPESVLGLFTAMDGGGRVRPSDRKIKSEFMIAADNAMGARDGELVQCEVLSGRVKGLPHAKVIERLGREDAPGAASLMAIHRGGIPTRFPQPALDQADQAAPAPMGERVDLRNIGLVTIDDEDARDFDDAVWAEADTDPANKGGWHLLVAIADVAWYVTPDSALDSSARERGNSVYFPDRVVPMLPEKLSNDLCSLRPDEDRPCLAVHIWVGRDGNKRRHEFVRGMMRSTARLTYRR
ncbi:MAG: RNB domain-containing ribonuclease, partial [Alphaproteobacteria bacterium]